MRTNRYAARLTALLLALFVLSACPCAAFAASGDEYGAKFLVSDDPSQVDVDIINFKARLNEQGFYSAGVTDDVLQSKQLDDLTMAAVKLVCRLNPEFTYYEDGVSNVLYWRVMGETEGPLVTPVDEEYPAIAPGSEGDAVTRVQNRLNQLGYDTVATFMPGVYDSTMQKAVDEFVRCNKLVYEKNSGITTELQEALFGDDAQAYSADQSFAERAMSYVRGTGNIFGLEVPNMVVLLVGLLLVVAIVVLIIKLAGPGGKKTVDAAEQIRFKVEYGGKSFVHSVKKGEPVSVGRGTGSFPLNPEDKSVSREHCQIVPENGALVLKDDSSYGTKVNGTLCHHNAMTLHSGDVIEIGKHRITVQFQE